MLNDPTLPPADREKKKYNATAAITASMAQRNQNQIFMDNCKYGAWNETRSATAGGGELRFKFILHNYPSAFQYRGRQLVAVR
jgi:hypothetical protein